MIAPAWVYKIVDSFYVTTLKILISIAWSRRDQIGTQLVKDRLEVFDGLTVHAEVFAQASNHYISEMYSYSDKFREKIKQYENRDNVPTH